MWIDGQWLGLSKHERKAPKDAWFGWTSLIAQPNPIICMEARALQFSRIFACLMCPKIAVHHMIFIIKQKQ
jgi:hypothetical protein